MPRSLAASFGALAMAIVVLRGALHGQPIDAVTSRALTAMLAFAGVGYVAGWIADYLIRDSLEQSFRSRVDWYRQGLIDRGLDSPTRSNGNPATGKKPPGKGSVPK